MDSSITTDNCSAVGFSLRYGCSPNSATTEVLHCDPGLLRPSLVLRSKPVCSLWAVSHGRCAARAEPDEGIGVAADGLLNQAVLPAAIVCPGACDWKYRYSRRRWR